MSFIGVMKDKTYACMTANCFFEDDKRPKQVAPDTKCLFEGFKRTN
ncbi:hypothetical protein BCO26_0838 [Heyndrickxia coagulans 2-6]|nr:hypothetical protein BCO26_0838 [Heyndrickxia coagulans 2-6]KYC63127.1 hypothetical protein B4100_0287 [Heyndrickxia coagulans]